MNLASIIRRERIEECLRHVPAAVTGGVINALVASAVMWSSGRHLEILLWLSGVCLAGALRMALYRSRLRTRHGTFHDRRDERQIERLGLLNGAIWGVGIALAARVATPGQFYAIAALSGGMMGAAAVTHASMARGALMFMSPIALGSMLAWCLNPLASPVAGLVLALNYLILLTGGAFNQQAQFVKRIEAREELRDSGATVKLLLNEFEAQSADWIWEVSEAGRIIAPSPRFGEAAGRAVALLEDTPFVTLFDETPGLDVLTHHLANRRAFRGLTFPLTIGGALHWWMLSARPTHNGTMRGVASDITAQRQAETRVSHLAHHDELTGLCNRSCFNERLEQALARHGDDPDKVAILCLDLDRFKAVNDSLGHPVGDRLLCEVSRRIEAVVRATDLVSRLGGDEFAILIEGEASRKIAGSAAQRIVDVMKDPFILDDMQILTGASVGIAVAEDDHCDGTTMMRRADLALYRAKAQGRGQFTHFETGMDEAAQERRNIEIDLRAAITEGQLALHYQPVVDVVSGEVVSYEALLRWHHPQRGLVMPSEFIPVAEETGLIVQMGEWVIREATAKLAQWPDHMRVAVNLSPVQLQSVNLVATVLHALASAGIEPHRLELEITENVFLLDNIVNSSILHKIRNIGIRIALDDFGTGYSSLNYLRAFPFDKIKIDRCFISELMEREDSGNIVRNIIGLARSLGMVTTAEGVEHPEQLAWLKAEGCDEAQGFLFTSLGFASEAAPSGQTNTAPFPQNKRTAQSPPVLTAGPRRTG